MDDSLESLLGKSKKIPWVKYGSKSISTILHIRRRLTFIEKATNPKNQYEDWEFIMAFCDRVNLEQEG